MWIGGGDACAIGGRCQSLVEPLIPCFRRNWSRRRRPMYRRSRSCLLYRSCPRSHLPPLISNPARDTGGVRKARRIHDVRDRGAVRSRHRGAHGCRHRDRPFATARSAQAPRANPLMDGRRRKKSRGRNERLRLKGIKRRDINAASTCPRSLQRCHQSIVACGNVPACGLAASFSRSLSSAAREAARAEMVPRAVRRDAGARRAALGAAQAGPPARRA
jgi:hypothetical protein